MDVTFPFPGRVVDHDRFDWAIFQPILFENVKNGPSGFVTIHVQALQIGDESLVIESSPEILTSSPGNRNPDKERPIERPVTWQPDGQGNNRLGIVIRPATPQSRPVAEQNDLPALLSLKIVFSNGVTIDVSVAGTLAKNGTLSFEERPQRTGRPVALLGNLIFLASITGSVFYWNYSSNAGVYLQDSDFSQQAIILLLGSLLAFFGLSITKIKGWFALFSDSLAFFRYPELHLGRTVYRSLSSWICTVVLVIASTAAGILIYKNWSVEVPGVPNLKLYDSNHSTRGFVPARRVYKSMLEESDGRIQFVCDRSDQNPDYSSAKYYWLLRGHQSAATFPEYVTIHASYRSASSPVPVTDSRPADQWFSSKERGELQGLATDVVQLLCREPSNQYMLGSGDIASVSIAPSGDIKIRVESEREVLASELWRFIEESCKEDIFTRFGGFDLFKSRSGYLLKIEDGLRDFLGRNGVITTDRALSITKELLDQVRTAPREKRDKFAVERSLLLRATWRVLFERNPGIRLSNEELEELSTMLQKILSKDRGWKTERVISEFGLDLIRLAEDARVSAAIHNALVMRWYPLGDCEFNSRCNPAEYFAPSLNYFALIFHIGAFGPEQEKFIFETWSKVLPGQSPRQVALTIYGKETEAREYYGQVIDSDVANADLRSSIEAYLRDKVTL